MADLNGQQKRGDGSTTKQILCAPKDATFIWCNERIQYAVDLAKSMERTDLRIVPRAALTDKGGVLEMENDIVIDHGVIPTASEVARINSLRVAGMRTVSTYVPEPNKKDMMVRADVIAWSPQGTGLMLRNEGYQLLGRLRLAPSQSADPQAQRTEFMALMERVADLINVRSSVTLAPDARPSQDKTEELDRDAALNIVAALMADPKTPKALKKKFSDRLGPLL